MRNLKRALSLVMAAAMLIGMMAVSASAADNYEDFTDKDEIKNTEAVATMVSLGVFNGKEDGSYFDPTGIVTRAEMAKIIAVSLNGGKDLVIGSGASTTQFSDTKGNWAEAYIAYCANLGIINGKGDGTFGPNEPVTGTAAAKMVLCALGYRSDIEGFTGAGWDLNTDRLANEVGLYDGLGHITPSNGLSRDDTAQLVYNGVQAQEVEYRNNYGEVFLNYLPYQSLPFKMLYVSEPNLLLNRIEWEGTIEYLVNPEDDYYSSFFTRKWNREMTMKIFPPRRGLTEINRTLQASYYLVREKLGQKIHKRPSPITLDEYLAEREK